MTFNPFLLLWFYYIKVHKLVHQMKVARKNIDIDMTKSLFFCFSNRCGKENTIHLSSSFVWERICSVFIGFYSLNGVTFYCKILWSFESAGFGVRRIALKFEKRHVSTAAELPLNFKAILRSLHRNSRILDLRFCNSTSNNLVIRGQVVSKCMLIYWS